MKKLLTKLLIVIITLFSLSLFSLTPTVYADENKTNKPTSNTGTTETGTTGTGASTTNTGTTGTGTTGTSTTGANNDSTVSGDICSNPSGIAPEVAKAAGCGGNDDALPTLITNILYTVIGVSGIVAVIYVLIGGYSYMTSTGDAQKLEKAKKTILYACIGLVICALAFAIVNFTITNILGGSQSNNTNGGGGQSANTTNTNTTNTTANTTNTTNKGND